MTLGVFVPYVRIVVCISEVGRSSVYRGGAVSRKSRFRISAFQTVGSTPKTAAVTTLAPGGPKQGFFFLRRPITALPRLPEQRHTSAAGWGHTTIPTEARQATL